MVPQARCVDSLDPAEKAELGDYRLIQELQSLFSNPYDEQTLEIGKKYGNKTKNEAIKKARKIGPLI